MGRSYGDVCLNDGGTLLLTRGLDRLISFDPVKGLLHAEAGITLDEILRLTVPLGWFLPVTPGTKYVTLGGAVANDVHGKNHHGAGTFGCHVRALTLQRSSDGQSMRYTSTDPMFRATVGGLGLTGLITSVELQLIPIRSRRIVMESIKAPSLDVMLGQSVASEEWEYTVGWIDGTARGAQTGRGHFMRGRFADASDGTLTETHERALPGVPMLAPEWVLSRRTISVFNTLYYQRQVTSMTKSVVDYEPFFYPLDAIPDWNRLYGRRGMLQYQCVVPSDENGQHARHILGAISASGHPSFLSVIKVFGNIPSPGMLSFPRPGITIAFDFPHEGGSLLSLMERLDDMVSECGGRVYPAKDARLSGRHFRAMYPELESFTQYIDPAFSSSFWRRVMEDRA
jgi:FAD/FMN-containing dehydrogenase